MRDSMTIDGNTAAAMVAFKFTEVAAIYPITPSTKMAELVEKWSSENVSNLLDEAIKVYQMQSEAGVAGAMHGSLAAGALSTTFTSSQGLLLMLPNLYKVAAERLPGVFYVAARTVASHALSIFGDHSDIYAARQTGCAMLCASSVQEILDLAPVAHAAALKGCLPVIFFFDGFRTSHEIQKINIWSDKDLKDFLDEDALEMFRNKALNPNHPKVMGSNQNPDVFFQMREASNIAYMLMGETVKEYMNIVNRKIGSDYKPFNYYGAPNATHVLVAMGSVCETAKNVVNYLNSLGEKVGVCSVHLFRPFLTDDFINEIPQTVGYISVLDKAKEPGAGGEPLYLDVLSAVEASNLSNVKIMHGRYGLASKDTTLEQIIAVFKNKTKTEFTIGINDDVTLLSLNTDELFPVDSNLVTCCKFWGRGSDGATSGCKCAAEVIGTTQLYSQAYFEYDSRKSGGLTVSHLRYSAEPIQAPYLIRKTHFAVCTHFEDLLHYDIIQEIISGGSLLINCSYDYEAIREKLPLNLKKIIYDKKIKIYTIDAFSLCRKLGLGKHISSMCTAAFLHIANILPEKECNDKLMQYVKKAYSDSGDDIYSKNVLAIEMGCKNINEIFIENNWLENNDSATHETHPLSSDLELSSFINNIQNPINAHKGDTIPVSSLLNYADGSAPSGTAAFEKCSRASFVPIWNPTACIQCNHCSFVCPHGAIRPFALTNEEINNGPNGIKSAPLKGIKDMRFTIGISVMDCTGCSSCISNCPAKGKALQMRKIDDCLDMQKYFDYAVSFPPKQNVMNKFKSSSVKGSQFKKPLFEFSGACAGCGQTPYAKLATQLFGEHMYIANATGCSSIWGNTFGSTPYTTTHTGKGPAWSNSLFEDAAEFGLGMLMANQQRRENIRDNIKNYITANGNCSLDFYNAAITWLNTYDSSSRNSRASADLLEIVSKEDTTIGNTILHNKDYLSKKSYWVFGGDGWAYDIGFGGLDYVLSTGMNINVLIFNTEVYSNTGGQMSGATPKNAIAKFASKGKKTEPKDLAASVMAHKNVYVAQVAMGADMNQCVKAMVEAESYNGPSVIIAYCPCIAHGLNCGMAHLQQEQNLAVQTGHFKLFRYDPRLSEKGLDPFQGDIVTPCEDYNKFLQSERRFKHKK